MQNSTVQHQATNAQAVPPQQQPWQTPPSTLMLSTMSCSMGCLFGQLGSSVLVMSLPASHAPLAYFIADSSINRKALDSV